MPTSKPKLLFVNRSYWPDNEATGQLLTELCEDLATQFDVHVVAGQPNVNVTAERFAKSGAAVHNHVTIHRVRHTRFRKSSFWGRLLNQLSFLIAATWRTLWLSRPAAVITESDPPQLCFLGALLKWRYRCPLIAYQQDIYPDVAVALGAINDNWFTGLLRRLFQWAFRQANLVLVPGEDMRQLLIGSGVPAERVVCLPNWIDTTLVRPFTGENTFRAEHQLTGKSVVMYSGNLGLSQRLDDVLLAAEELAPSRKNLQFVLVGDGARREQLQKLVAERGLTNVQFVPYQPKTRLTESLGAADVHLIPMDDRVINFLFPSKLYGILAAGKASLVIAPRNCELARLVSEHHCGRAVEPRQIDQLVECIAWYADHPEEAAIQGANARRLAEESYDRALITAQFASLLAQLLISCRTGSAVITLEHPPKLATHLKSTVSNTLSD